MMDNVTSFELMTSTVVTSAAELVPLPTTLRIIIALYLFVLVVVGCLGNLGVIYIYFVTKDLHTAINALVVNLSASDFCSSLFGTGLCFLHLVANLSMTDIVCNFYGFITYVTGAFLCCIVRGVSIGRFVT